MHYPIKFRETFNETVYEMVSNKGFRFKDTGGILSVATMEIVNDSLIRIVFSTTSVSEPDIIYAGITQAVGRGNVYDSNTSICPLDYKVNAYSFSGESDIDLNNKPYPFENPASPQKITAIAY